MAQAQRLRPDGPDGCDPGEARAGVPLVGEIDPETRADHLLDLVAGFECQQSRIADEQGGIGLLEHGDGVRGILDEGGVCAEKLAEEDLGICEGAARGGVGCDGANVFEGVGLFDDELDGADAVERGDGAAGDDREIGCKRSDRDEAQVGAAAEKLVGAEGGFGVMKAVVLGEICREGRMLEVPHERGWIEKVDGGYTDGMG